MEDTMQRYLSLPDREAHEGLRIKWTLVPKKLDYRIKISVSWLLSVQDPTGYWDARGPWLSGAVIRALLAAKHKVPEFHQQIDIAVKQGIDWLVSGDIMIRQPHGGLAWDPNLGTWDTAVILRALLASEYSDHSVLNGVKNWLYDQVGRTYFGSTTVPFGESYPAQTFLALEEAGETIYSRGVGQIFRDRQLGDGSWGDHFNTAEVLQYLAHHKNDNDNSEAIVKAVSYIEHTQSPSGTWSSLTWPTAITLMAYLEMSRNPYSLVTIRALEYMSGQQHINGSWFHLLADTTFAMEALVLAVDKLDFSHFDFITDSDFKMSSITVIPDEVIGKQILTKRDVIQVDRRVFNLIRVGLGIVAVLLIYTIVTPLIQGWGTLTLPQKFDLVFKLLGALIASLISVFAPIALRKSKQKRTTGK
jgi:hypothetical protein